VAGREAIDPHSQNSIAPIKLFIFPACAKGDQDRLAIWQDRMLECRRLGVKLGLLINLQSKQVESCRPGQETEVFGAPGSIASGASEAIDCNEVMPGLILSMSRIW
jgi:hypothetical protein